MKWNEMKFHKNSYNNFTKKKIWHKKTFTSKIIKKIRRTEFLLSLLLKWVIVIPLEKSLSTGKNKKKWEFQNPFYGIKAETKTKSSIVHFFPSPPIIRLSGIKKKIWKNPFSIKKRRKKIFVFIRIMVEQSIIINNLTMITVWFFFQ